MSLFTENTWIILFCLLHNNLDTLKQINLDFKIIQLNTMKKWNIKQTENMRIDV